MKRNGEVVDSGGEYVLNGGGLASVVRVGETVRRPTGSWTPAVHALLHHLERVGFEAAPRVQGVDEKGREILTFVPGETGVPPDDEALVETARFVRRFHDAISAFRPPPDARWQVMVGAPASGDLVCHNDLSPANTVTRSQRPIAFLDWDLAAPGTRLWDIAYAVWRFVPLYRDDDCLRLGFAVRPRGPECGYSATPTA